MIQNRSAGVLNRIKLFYYYYYCFGYYEMGRLSPYEVKECSKMELCCAISF